MQTSKYHMDTKYIFVTGGVVSSLGKGIISASIGKLLQARGFKVTIQKFDPYINIDPGTLNPYEHGECYVTVDWTATAGVVPYYTTFYDTTGFAVTNLSLRADKEIKITDKFSVPVFGQVVANPSSQKAYLVFGFTLRP